MMFVPTCVIKWKAPNDGKMKKTYLPDA